MNTVPVAKEETLEQIARRIASKDFIARQDLADEILSALRNEREACAKVADTFQIEMLTGRIPALKAQDNTAKGIAAVIRGRTE